MWLKIPSTRFYNKTIILYRTNILVSHSIPQNYFRWNFSRWTAGEGRSKGTLQTRNNQGNQHIKTNLITSKVLFKNQKYCIVQARPSVHQPIHHPTPHHTHPEERIWVGQTPRRKPWVPDAPKIKHDKMKQFYMIDMERKMWYYHLIKKVRIPLAREGKISLAMINQTIQRSKIDFAEGWQTRGT